MIRNFDGTLMPMDEPYFQAKHIAKGTWQILSDGDYMYLVEGEREAVLIDSGYGCGNIRKFCQGLTDKPVNVVFNTHHHFDHVANNQYFDCAYMSNVCKQHVLSQDPFPSFSGISFSKEYKIKTIEAGDSYRFGDRSLEVFSMRDHADSSLLYLDRVGKILFVGDELVPTGKDLKGSVKKFRKELETIAEQRDSYDILCSGGDIMEASLIDDLLIAVDKVLSGEEGERDSRPPHDSQKQPIPGGSIIYDRHRARPSDNDHGDHGMGNKERRVYRYKSCEFIYSSDQLN